MAVSKRSTASSRTQELAAQRLVDLKLSNTPIPVFPAPGRAVRPSTD